MNSNDTAPASSVNGSTCVSHVVNKNSWSMSCCSRNCTVSRFGAPPSGVPDPPTAVPHATAINKAEPKALLPTSSMPM